MKYPKQKDIIWIDFDPSKGKDIRKRIPALVETCLMSVQVFA